MGKRSRVVQTRRMKKETLEKVRQRRALVNLCAGAFCCIAAMFSERYGAEFTVAWLGENCYLPEQDATESIATGQRLIARGRRNLSQ
jgi:hypothetical protein